MKKIDRAIIKEYMVSRVDTMKAVTKKKGFFKKLGALFSSKNDDEIKYVKGGTNTENAKDSAESALDSNITKMADDIQNYYQRTLNKEVDIRKKLNDSEKQLAETNLSIVNKISASLKSLLYSEEKLREQLNLNAFNNAVNARNSIQKLFWVSLLIILFIVALLVYNIFKMVNYEKDILEAREQAEKLAQVKSRFLSNMSHEIRSPLTSIMGFTELIDKIETDPEKKNFLQAIKTSSEHLLSTVNDVLDFSKLDAGKLKLELKPFLLSKAIKEVSFALSTTSAAKKHIDIHTKIELDENMVVNGDLFRLKQILYNLLSNAVKFTDHGSVTVKASLDKTVNDIATIKIMVQDTGIGIPADHLDTIFEEFTQVASSSSSKENRRAIKGTGLGLSICKMLVELQGGTIGVESLLNQGSTFSFTIPYQIDHAEQAPEQTTTILNTHSLKGKYALVIEDNDVNIMLLTMLLKKLELNFDIAKDGAEGLAKFETNQYDIVLTDINVPKLTGDQLATAVRKMADPNKSAVPIIALTATIMRDDIEAYLHAGINDILVKPFKQAELKSMIEKYIFTN
ncbi:MAG: ATP-binding protein [Sediminibacterium sp.]|nr:ATP-binding protein [Sediminibacterium sp.]